MLVGGALPMLARAARDDSERLAYALQRIFEVSLILGVAAAVGLLGGAQFVIHVIAGPKYAGADAVPCISRALRCSPRSSPRDGVFALISLKRYGSLIVINALAFLASSGLTIWLAATHGARGAALATVCGEATLAVGALVALVHDQPELSAKLVVLAKVTIAAIPAVALELSSDLSSLVRALLALAVYGVLIR